MKNQRSSFNSRVTSCRNAYSLPSKHGLTMGDSKDMTRQEMRDECDINRIMAKYLRSGNVDHVQKWGGQYMDVSAITYQEAMNCLLTADAMFKDLPSELRKRFDNKPEQFLLFVQDPKNKDQLSELGLAAKPHIPPAPPVPKLEEKKDNAGT